MRKNLKQKEWFIYVRRSYLPSSWQGLVIYMLYVVYVILLIVLWYQKGRQYWTLMTVIIPLIIGAAFITQYIASKNSKN
jgi:multidrug efflux pump subunit AcrB